MLCDLSPWMLPNALSAETANMPARFVRPVTLTGKIQTSELNITMMLKSVCRKPACTAMTPGVLKSVPPRQSIKTL